MQRRSFIRNLLFGFAAIPARHVVALKSPETLVLQRSHLAGVQYYAGKKIWATLVIGAILHLVREPAKLYDKKTVAVYTGHYKLGFLPRVGNTTVASLMDNSRQLFACITQLCKTDNPWQRIQLDILPEMPQSRHENNKRG